MTQIVLWSRASVFLCVCLSANAWPHYCGDRAVTWRSGRGCPLFLVVHNWANNLQSVYGLRWYVNITRTRNVSEYVLVHALCRVHDCYYHWIRCQKYHGIPYEKYHGFLAVGGKMANTTVPRYQGTAMFTVITMVTFLTRCNHAPLYHGILYSVLCSTL